MKRKKESKIEFKDAKTKKNFINAFAKFESDTLIDILKNSGEIAFRTTAKCFGLSEKEINEVIKLWKKDVKENEKI